MAVQTAKRRATCILLPCLFWFMPGEGFGQQVRPNDLASTLVTTGKYEFVDPAASDPAFAAGRRALCYLRPNRGGSFAAEIDEVNGLPVEKTKVLLYLKPNGRVEDFKAVLDRHGLAVPKEPQRIYRSGIVIVELTDKTPAIARMNKANPNPSHIVQVQALLSAIDDLVKEELVIEAAPNSWIGSGELSSEKLQSIALDGNHKCVWQFDKLLAQKAGGNECGTYGLIMTRFPAAWNFNHYIQRKNRNLPVRVGVIDVGRVLGADNQPMHADLKAEIVPIAGTPGDSDRWDMHTMHVSGIIGAQWNNGFGIDGACKHCRLMVATISRKAGADAATGEFGIFLLDLIEAVGKMIDAKDDVRPRVINVSMGYNWEQTPDNKFLGGDGGELKPTALALVSRQGSLMAQTAIRQAREKGIIFVCAAGNDSRGGNRPLNVHCKWGLPFNWAAHNRAGDEPPAKNVLIVGAVGRDGERAGFSNGFGHVAAPGVGVMSLSHLDEQWFPWRTGVRLKSGTSMAAPFVTALIAQVYACYPKTTWQKMVDILSDGKEARETPPIVDAFDAILKADDDSLLHLADLNDDDVVDDNDECVLRCALESYRRDEQHNFWPREDLNGDGVVSRDKKKKVWVSTLKMYKELTDLEVMEIAQTEQKIRDRKP